MRMQILKATDNCDEDYLNYIRGLHCAKCGRTFPPSEAHHQHLLGHGSKGMKCSDYRAVPLCQTCHETYHRVGRITFWRGFNVELIIFRLQRDYFFIP